MTVTEFDKCARSIGHTFILNTFRYLYIFLKLIGYQMKIAQLLDILEEMSL